MNLRTGRAFGAAAVAFAVLISCTIKTPPQEVKVPEEAPAQKAAVPEEAPARKAAALGPGVYLVNENYDRVKSRILMRRVVGPTLARLDFAAYDSNVLLHDPKDYDPKPPEKKVLLGDLDFGGSVEKDSLCDHIDETSLTDAEKLSPMAWEPMSEYLLVWDAEQSMGLYELGGLVSNEMWNDDSPVQAYQEISRAFLHKTADGPEMWVRIEFKPWVRFLDGIDDEDDDGFPEVYGRLRRDVLSLEIAEELLTGYAGRVLSIDDINRNGGWTYVLVDFWYNKYFTETPEPEQKKAWPDEKTRADLGDELSAMPDEEPTVVIRGQPFEGHFVWTILYVHGAAE